MPSLIADVLDRLDAERRYQFEEIAGTIEFDSKVPRDEAGNVVGKGDMRAQIEQVGKNAGACLKAAGATVNDIVSTISFVTAPAELDRNADLLPRYFGPPTTKKVPTTRLSNPDFLLEVEGIAAIK